jgi:hypothetical protein
MTSIRRFAFASVLALSTLAFLPSLAAAQSPARGQFTLPHEVHWQNAIVPAGDYKFSLQSDGAVGVLTLVKLSGAGGGFVFLVKDTDEIKPAGASQLVLERTSGGSYVSAMQLPQFGVRIHFTVPEEKVLRAENTAGVSAGR